MILIYEQGFEDFGTMGLGELRPASCLVREEQGGVYELELEHPMDEDLKYDLLKSGRVLKVPAPAQTTPEIQLEAVSSREVWKANQDTKVYSKASTSLGSTVEIMEPTPYPTAYLKPHYVYDRDEYWTGTTKWKPNGNRVLAAIKAGDDVTIIKTSGAYSQIITEDGVTGYVPTAHITLDHTIPGVPAEEIQAGQVRDQLFRIYRVEKDTNSLTVRAWARHIFYDLLGVALISCKVEGGTVAQALAAIQAAGTQTDHGFEFKTNSTATITGDWSLRGAVEALMDPDDGVLNLANLRMVRDNYTAYLLTRSTKSRAPITYGANLIGVTLDINEDGIVNRIVPVGQTADGAKLLLTPTYIDSPRNSEATMIRAAVREYPEAKVSDTMTEAQALAKLEELAEADFEAGIDLPEMTVTVDFLQLGDTDEYAQYKALDRLYLGDIVTVIDNLHGIELDAEVTAYEYDALRKRYTGMTVGVTNARRTIGSVGAYMLPNGSLSGRKIALGGVDGSRLGDKAVTAGKVADGTIGSTQLAAAAKIEIEDTANANLILGGVNLLKSTYLFDALHWTYSFPAGSAYYLGANGTSANTMLLYAVGLESGYAYVLQSVVAQELSEYVLSVNYLVSSSDTFAQHAYVCAIEYDSGSSALASHYIPITSAAPNAEKFASFTTLANCAMIVVQAVAAAGFYIYWEKVKLEIGNKNTAWTEAIGECHNPGVYISEAGIQVKTGGDLILDAGGKIAMSTGSGNDATINNEPILHGGAGSGRVWVSTSEPAGMEDGDLWIKPDTSVSKSGNWTKAALSSHLFSTVSNHELTGIALGAGEGTYKYTVNIPIFHSDSNTNEYDVTVYLAASSGGTTINMGTYGFSASGWYTHTLTDAAWLGNATSVWCRIVLEADGNKLYLAVNSGQPLSVVCEDIAAGSVTGVYPCGVYRKIVI